MTAVRMIKIKEGHMGKNEGVGYFWSKDQKTRILNNSP